MSIRPLAVAFGLSAMLLGAAVAAAETPLPADKGTPEGRGGRHGRLAACQKDFEAFCASVERGKGQRLKCLQENSTKLTPDCKTAVEAVLADRAARAANGEPPAKQ